MPQRKKRKSKANCMWGSPGEVSWLNYLDARVGVFGKSLGKRKNNWSGQKLAAYFSRKYPVEYTAWKTLRRLEGK